MDALGTTTALQLALTAGGGDLLTMALLSTRRRLRAGLARKLGPHGSGSSNIDLDVLDEGGVTYVQCSRWLQHDIVAGDIRHGLAATPGTHAAIQLLDAGDLEHLVVWPEDDRPEQPRFADSASTG